MAIIKWNPFEEIDRFFEEDFIPFLPAFRVSENPVDVYQKDGKVYVEMPLAGYKPEEINVEIEGNRLKISGKIERKEEEEGKDYFRREVRKGSFERVISLPENVLEEEGEAEFENGLLRIVFPLKEKEVSSKKIEIRKK